MSPNSWEILLASNYDIISQINQTGCPEPAFIYHFVDDTHVDDTQLRVKQRSNLALNALTLWCHYNNKTSDRHRFI